MYGGPFVLVYLNQSALFSFNRATHFLGRLTKLCQMGTVKGFITSFEQLAIHTKNLSYEFYTKCFISGIKEGIRAHVQGNHPPNWFEAFQRALEAKVIINTQNPCYTFTTKRKWVPFGNRVNPLKKQRLSLEEMKDRKHKGLCNNCYEKNVEDHYCRKQKLFHIDVSTTPERK